MDLIPALNLQMVPAAPDVVAFTGAAGKTTTLLRLSAEIVARGKRVVATSTCQMSEGKVALFPAVVRVTDARLPLDELTKALAAHGQCLLIGAPFDSKNGPKGAAVAVELVEQAIALAADLNVGTILVEADGSRQRAVKAPSDREPVVPPSTTLLVPIVGFDALGRRLNEEYAHRPDRLGAVLDLPTDVELTRLTPEMVAQLVVHAEGGAKDLPTTAQLLPMLNRVDDSVHLASARLVAQCLIERGQSCLISRVGVADAEPIRERWAPATVVVLAAGESRRMGRPKQLEAVDGEAMVVRAVRVALQSGAQQVMVVLGAYADPVRNALTPLCAEASSRIHLLHNDEWQSGQASSVRAAVDALPSATQVALFMPVDQPFMTPVVLRNLLRRWRTGALLAAPRVDGQVRGAPALFDKRLWPHLRALDGDVGARAILQQQQAQLATVTVPPHFVRDIDSPADLDVVQSQN